VGCDIKMKKNFVIFLFVLTGSYGIAQDIPASNNASAPGKKPTKEIEPVFRASVSYGLSYIPEKIPDNAPEWIVPYLNKLRMGTCLSADLNIYTYKTSGLTIKSSLMKAKNQMEITLKNQNGQSETGIMRDDISVFFIGAGLFGRGSVGPGKKCFMDAQLALGYLSFNNHGMLVEPLNIGGEGFAGYCSFGFDYLLSKSFAVGVDVGSPICTLREISLSGAVNKIMKLDLEHSIQVSRLNFSVGIKGYVFE